MRRSWMVFALLFLFSTAWAGEQLVLTTPETTASVTTWSVDAMSLDRSAAHVSFRLLGSGGERKTVTVSGADATTYMKALNKRNATVRSNEKWTIEQLQTAGLLGAGSVTGTPD